MAPGTRAARRAVTVIFFLNGALIGSWAARIPAVKEDLGLGEAELGVALGLVALGALVAMPVSGWLSARGGSRRTTRLAFVVFCVTLPLPALAPAYALLLPAALLLGVGNGSLDVAMNAHGVAVERRHERPILSSFHAAFSCGALAGAGTSALAAAGGLDVRWHLLAAAALALPAGLAACRALLPADADHAGEEAGPLLARPPRALWAVGAIAFCALVCEGATADWSAVYVRESLDAQAGIAALAFAAFSATMTLGRLAGDRLTSAWGAEALVRRGGLLSAAALGAALLIGRPAAAIAGFALLGFGIAAMVPVVFRAAAEVDGVAPGVGIAAASTMGYFGFLVAPPIIGGVAEVTSLPFALGLLVLFGLVMAALAPRVRPRMAGQAALTLGAPARSVSAR
jgi:MFS family permease